jgi:hypothetical protein
MKRIILTVALSIASLASNAQVGVITTDKSMKEVPVGFWYVVNDKMYNNQMFFYDETKKVKFKLQEILNQYGLDISNPKGIDTQGDNYWIITDDNGFVTYLYLTSDDAEGINSFIISLTK